MPSVSNFNISLLEECQSYTKYKIVNNQIHYSLSAREYESNGTLDYCRKKNILVTAYRPLGESGELSNTQEPLMIYLMKKYNKTTAQISINWLIHKPNTVVLVKTSQQEHLDENLGALDRSPRLSRQ